MQEHEPGTVRNDLLERLRNLEGPSAPGSLAELSYRRAKEALEKALEDARNIRLQALEDARLSRERESSALAAQLTRMRDEAQAQIDNLLRTAEIEAERTRDTAKKDAEDILASANEEAATLRAEAHAIRSAADERAREVERIEHEFNYAVQDIATRLGIQEKPSKGWLRRGDKK